MFVKIRLFDYDKGVTSKQTLKVHHLKLYIENEYFKQTLFWAKSKQTCR